MRNTIMDPAMRPERTAQLPIMPPSVSRLVAMLDEGKSYNQTYDYLCSESSLLDGIHTSIDITGDDMRILFHTLSRPLLRSLLMKTLGHDLYSKDFRKPNYLNVYDNVVCGTYGAFMFIDGRRGAFLTKRETQKLINCLALYAKGVSIYDRDSGEDSYARSQLPSDEKEALNFTQEVDDILRSSAKKRWDPEDSQHQHQRPRFAMTEGGEVGIQKDCSANIQNLIAMFERRCLPRDDSFVVQDSIDEDDGEEGQHRDDPDDIYQLQSPLLIGNSGNINKRAFAHQTDSTMDASSKVWALTISCIRHLEIPVKVGVVPLFGAWRDDQIDPSEVLGTIIACSLLPLGDGCNVKQPGTRGREGQTRDPGFEDTKKHIFAFKPWFRENLELSLKRPSDGDLQNGSEPALRKALEDLRGSEKRLKEGDVRLQEAFKDLDGTRSEFARTIDASDEFIGFGRGLEDVERPDDDFLEFLRS
ncbi:hypothetical protein F4780DRAFT_744765 [Xylariomycetidae sp. FL0641]|nr:hypothetical protein F4780DRAFT_744765 [Xylariomycetidae sp. FL0641]